MLVLGISAFYHDSAAALVRDDRIVAAAQEERFNRIKHYEGFPSHAIAYCLDEAGVTLDDVDYVCFYEKPILTFDRLIETYLAFAPSGFASFVKAIPIWVKEKLLQHKLLHTGLAELGRGELTADRLIYSFHHHSHAASAFFPSPFERAAVLTMDGVGEWATTAVGHGDGNALEMLQEIRFPHSLGMLYSAFTYYLGFQVNEGEYKVMGLAPYGEPKYAQKIRDELIDLKPDGSFRLNMAPFNYCTGLTMTNARFDRLFQGERRKPGAPLTQRHMDLASSVQSVVEDAVLRLARHAHERTGSENLCLAGGVALNCVANGRLLREGPFERLWIQPAAGDAGGALGAALAVVYGMRDETGGPLTPRTVNGMDAMAGALLGPAFSDQAIRDTLEAAGATFRRLDEAELIEEAVAALSEKKVVGWFQGRMEFGPRALGNRSILGDPRSPTMQKLINLKIKYRESFRPFAPAILADKAADYFEIDRESPYMLLVAPVAEGRRRTLTDEERALAGIDKLAAVRSDIPAVTHVDYSARVQTVDGQANPLFHRLLEAFHAQSGCPVLVNTSFNIRDEPIVCTPSDAYNCFMGTEMDLLAIGNFVLRKEDQG